MEFSAFLVFSVWTSSMTYLLSLYSYFSPCCLIFRYSLFLFRWFTTVDALSLWTCILADPGAESSRFQVRTEEPWGHCLTRLIPNGRSRSGIWLVPENLCVFLPNQSEVCLRVPSCVLTRTCAGSSVARLVFLGRVTKLCLRWKVIISGTIFADNLIDFSYIVCWDWNFSLRAKLRRTAQANKGCN